MTSDKLKIGRIDLSGLLSVLIDDWLPVARCSLLLVLLLLSISCGKKAPPTLRAYEKPQAPSGLTAYHREDRMILSWSYPDSLRAGLKGFEILRSGGNGFEKLGPVNSSQSSFADETFKLDVTYNYKVVAQSQKGVLSSDSNIITVTPKAVPPPPENVRSSVEGNAIVLSWTSSGQDVCYNIYRTAERGNYGGAPVNKEPVCATSYTDAAVSPGMPVYYSVRSLRMSEVRNEGSLSEEIEVSPSRFALSPPSDLRVVKGDKISLMWKESPEPWVRGYRVYRRIEGEEVFTLLGEVKAPAFTDAGKTDKKVWYMIKAVGPVTESEPLVVEVK